jgi:hypothetical protein
MSEPRRAPHEWVRFVLVMNWHAMSRRLIGRADGTRNETLTLGLFLVLLTPTAATAFDGSLSLELSGGNRTLSASLIGDWGIVPDTLYLVAMYGVVRQAPTPEIRSTATHLFGLGLDWIPSIHLMTSLNLSFSPKATDSERLGEFDITHTRRSVQGIFALGYQSAGFRRVEWSADLSGLVAWYELVSRAVGPADDYRGLTNLGLVKPALGATLIILDDNEVGLRGTYTWYSSDPTTAGGFDRLANDRRFQLIQARFGQLDANANFSSAPPWFELRGSYLRRFGSKVTGRFAYTYIQYVPGEGRAHALNTRWSFKLAGWARLWVGVTVQYDQPGNGLPYLSGYGTLGAELATE